MEITQETMTRCNSCKKEFTKNPSHSYGNYCSERCKSRARANDSNRKPNATCLLCNKPYYTRPHNKATHLYCSWDCYITAHHEIRICPRCRKEFTAEKWDPKQYCTVQCANLDLKSKETTNRVCPICNREFQAWGVKKKQQFCSKECAGKAKDRREMRPCECCGKEFYPPKGQYETKCCSAECGHKIQDKKTTLTCPVCQKVFRVSPTYVKRGQKYCSTECAKTEKPPSQRFSIKLEKGIRTNIEAIMEKTLLDLGIHYIWEKRFGRYWADFFLPDRNIAIECDEPYWHHDHERDARKDAYLLSKHQVKVLRFTTQQIKGDIRNLLTATLDL